MSNDPFAPFGPDASPGPTLPAGVTPRRPGGPVTAGKVIGALVGLLLVITFLATMATIIITIAIWPGEALLTAPLLCPEHQPEAFVVEDTHQVSPGETSTNFTLYCVGPRGDFTDAGFARSFMLLTALHAAVLLGLTVLVLVLRRLTRGRSGP